MKSTTTIAAAVAMLSSAHALTPEQNAQVNVVVQDIRGHLNEYLQFAQNNPGFHIPDGIMDVYSKAATYTDDSYTTLFDEVNMDQFTQAVTQLPWYSERILPSLVPGAQGAAPTPVPAPAPAPAPAAPAPAAPAPAAPAPAAPAPASPAPAATTEGGSGGDSGSDSQPNSSSSGEGSNTSSSARPSASAAGNQTHHNSTSSGHHSSTSSRGSGGRTSVSTTRAAGSGQSLQGLSTGFGIVAAGIAGLLL